MNWGDSSWPICQRVKKYDDFWINAIEFVITHKNVNEQVNLLTKSCSCYEFNLDHMPRRHDMASCYKYKIS